MVWDRSCFDLCPLFWFFFPSSFIFLYFFFQLSLIFYFFPIYFPSLVFYFYFFSLCVPLLYPPLVFTFLYVSLLYSPFIFTFFPYISFICYFLLSFILPCHRIIYFLSLGPFYFFPALHSHFLPWSVFHFSFPLFLNLFLPHLYTHPDATSTPPPTDADMEEVRNLYATGHVLPKPDQCPTDLYKVCLGRVKEGGTNGYFVVSVSSSLVRENAHQFPAHFFFTCKA